MNELHDNWPGPLWPYVALVRAYLDRRLVAEELEAVYLAMFKRDDFRWPSDIFEPLNEIFLDLDAYWPHGSGEDRFAIASDDVLRDRISKSFEVLSARRWSIGRIPPTTNR